MAFRHKRKILCVGLLIVLGLGALNMGINPFYWRRPLDNSSPSLVRTSEGRPLRRPDFADLPYAAESPFEKLDLYLPTHGSAPAPLIIWIHGGGMSVGDKRSMPRRDFGPAPQHTGRNGPFQIQVPDVDALTAKGYAVVSLNYRLGISFLTNAKSAVRDGKAAVRFLRANADKYNLDARKFAVWGNSSGGYIAAMIGVTADQSTVFDDPKLGNPDVSCTVNAVVVWYGAEDRFFDEKFLITHYLSGAKIIPPFLIVNGDADPIISPERAQRLQKALIDAGATSTLTILKGAGHEDPLFMATQMSPTFSFLDKALDR